MTRRQRRAFIRDACDRARRTMPTMAHGQVCAGCNTTDPYDHEPACAPAGDPRHPGDPR